jgi:hypothetical protein
VTVRIRCFICLVLVAVVVAGCGRDGGDDAAARGTGDAGARTACDVPLEATDVGITADAITIEVMADVGSPLSPGLFQANVDGVKAFAESVNADGGLACRRLVVREWDSKLTPDESKNGLIDACAKAVAMVGGNSLFNPDVAPLSDCKDAAGATTGLPNIAGLANDINEQCAPTTFTVQVMPETCPVRLGVPRPLKAVVGPTKHLVAEHGPLHGLFLVPGDLPTTVQSATYQIKAQADAGVRFDGTPKVSGRDEQAAYTPKVQLLKAAASNYVFNGAGDRAMVSMRKESKAQGADDVKVWVCSLGCYKPGFLTAGGADVEGTYVWMQFLPFEEASSNEALRAYVDAVGATKVDSFGAQAWQAGLAFKQVVDRIVDEGGPNAVTRAAILDGLRHIGSFDAGGWMGSTDLKGVSPCYVLLQVRDGAFARVHPTKPGTFDCDPGNVVTVTLDPAKEAAAIK